MLTIGRTVGQAVVVGTVEIAISEIRGSRVTLIVTSGANVRLIDRYHDEHVTIGEITVWVRRHRCQSVRLAIDAPPRHRIMRKELLSKLATEASDS